MDGLSCAVEGNDDGEAYGDFCGGDGDDEENKHLTIVVGQAVDGVKTGEGDEGERGGGKHHFQAHEDDDNVAPHDDATEADGEKQTGEEEVFVEGWSGHGKWGMGNGY